jgi:hypothetical protein
MKYQIRYEEMGGMRYYMIYRKWWILPWVFYERWSKPESVSTRLKELTNAPRRNRSH